MCLQLLQSLFKATRELPSPHGYIPRSNVIYNDDTNLLIIKGISKPWITTVADTNSLDPVIDAGHTAILTGDFKPDDLQCGDIVVYQIGASKIIHRIVKVSADSGGRYFMLKGDNNAHADPYRVRDGDITYLLVGIIYTKG